MKAFTLVTKALFSLSLFSTTYAANSFSASNLYYAAGLTDAQSTTLLTGLKSAGVKVLRVWLDGESGSPKGTDIKPYWSLQTDSPTSFNDTVLNRLDDFMVKAHGYGIKLLISIHSYNALKGKSDFYGQWYGTGDFYTDPNAISHYKARIAHVLAHVNPYNSKPWGQSSEYIFAFETQNEAMHELENPDALAKWQCTMADAIRAGLEGNTGILVTTGGGSYLKTSILNAYYTCENLDVIAIHGYGVGDFDTNALGPYVSKAQSYGKKLIYQEWGACYTTASNNNCNGGSALDSGTRDANIKKWAQQIDAAGIPWFYWQIIPNNDPHSGWDYEVGIDDVNWEALKEAGIAAGSASSAFDFSPYLL